MERLRRRELEEPAPAPLPEVARAQAEVVELPDPLRETVQVIWGPLVQAMQVVGMTVAEVRALLRAPFHLAPQAAAYVNGRAVEPEHRLASGETLQFRREFGEKGACP